MSSSAGRYDDNSDRQVDLAQTMHSVMMSAGLDERIDPTDIYGDGETAVSDVTGDVVSVPCFRCGVTLDDEQELTCVVQGFQMLGSKRVVKLVMTPAVIGELCTRRVKALNVVTADEISVFAAEFDVDDMHDTPDITYEQTDVGPMLTLEFVVDIYEEE